MGLTCQIQLLANLAERMNPNATTVVSEVTGQSLVQSLPEQLQRKQSSMDNKTAARAAKQVAKHVTNFSSGAWPLGETHPTRTRFTQRGKGPARANDQKGPSSPNMLLPHRNFPQE